MNFFDRVPKSVSLAALAEIGGPALSARYAKTRKAELAQSCERIFAGDFIGDVKVKAAALAWVPDAMRFAAAADPKDEADTPPWEDLPGTGLAGAGEAPALEALGGPAADGSEFEAAGGEGDPGDEREGSVAVCGIEEAA